MTQIDGTLTAHATGTKPLFVTAVATFQPACRRCHRRRVRSRTFRWPRNIRSPGRRRRRDFFRPLVDVLDDGEHLSRNKMEGNRIARISITWRGRQLDVDADPSCTVKEFGQLLQDLTNVKPDTLKLIVPQSTNKGSKLITPFSDPHSILTLNGTGISEGKPIRMMGVYDDEIEEVSDNGKRPDQRIIGFDEEEQRLRQRSLGRPQISLKLPQGQYIFCDFRTLHLPGIELNPPPSEALKRMHMLACDPGIIAIMKKNKWRIGIMTEMAPVGYVGISPKCILGFNKNMGEEISLRLRTDDLKGFRKYESIKKTLLHELAHMVHSEHDANFFALNKQLNEEAASMDWTKSTGHMLSGRKIFDSYEEEFVLEPEITVAGHKLGGESSSLASARALSGAAAYQRFLNASAKVDHASGTKIEYNPDDVPQGFVHETVKVEPDPDCAMHVDSAAGLPLAGQDTIGYSDPNPDDVGKLSSDRCLEPDPDDSSNANNLNQELRFDVRHHSEPDPDDGSYEVPEHGNTMEMDSELTNSITVVKYEVDPADSSNANQELVIEGKHGEEPDPDDTCQDVLKSGNGTEMTTEQSGNSMVLKAEPDPDDHVGDSNINELQKVEEPVRALCSRLQKSIEMLRLQATRAEAESAIQTLFKIIKNVIEHPNDIKYKRLRKSNPHFQRSVANYKAAMEVLELIGFCDDVISDEIGRAETYLVLKRNDPGLLWLAKSSLEVSLA